MTPSPKRFGTQEPSKGMNERMYTVDEYSSARTRFAFFGLVVGLLIGWAVTYATLTP